jgi:RNA polymerase sigma-70 factor (ECF subfamily)
LVRVAVALGVKPGRVDDVLQDVCIAAWQHAPNISEPDELWRWLFRVAINRCHLEHRKNRRWRGVFRRLVESRRTETGVNDTAIVVDRKDERNLVRLALTRLGPRLRSVLIFRYFADMNSKEIGQILNLPDATVRSHLRVARRQLAEELERCGYRYDL